MVWCRANGAVPNDLAIHQYLLAYASDFSFLTTALNPHGVSWLTPGIRMASLDHASGFTAIPKISGFYGYGIAVCSWSARLRTRADFFEDGTLVASTAQEGVIRLKDWLSESN